MNDIRNGKVYGLVFIIFIIVLGIGGFFLTKTLTSNKEIFETPEETVADNSNLKLNKNEEYIYFLNDDLRNSEYDINYHDIKININNSEARNLENNLNQEMSSLKETYTLIVEQELEPEEQEKIIYLDSGIYEAKYNKYTRYINKDYASLLKTSYEFNCYDGEKFLGSKAYTFDLNTGKLLHENELLSIYNLSLDKVKETVKTRLESKQTMIQVPTEETIEEAENLDTTDTTKNAEEVKEEQDSLEEATKEVELIDILGTLKSLDNPDNYALYIDKSGYLTISYLVKTQEIDYNDVIILN